MRQIDWTKNRNKNIALMRKLLEKHDWFYQMSDDGRVYERGEQEKKVIEKLAESDGTLRRMYDSVKKKKYNV